MPTIHHLLLIRFFIFPHSQRYIIEKCNYIILGIYFQSAVCAGQTSISSAQRVGFFNSGSGRELDKIPGSGSGSGRVGVSINTIRYFRVSFFLSGISGYFGYFRVCRVFSGISGFTHIY